MKILTGEAPIAARDENVQFRPQNLHIWSQKSIFCFGIVVLSTGHITITITPGDTTLPLSRPRKEFPFLSYGSFSGVHPGFWPFRASAQSLL